MEFGWTKARGLSRRQALGHRQVGVKAAQIAIIDTDQFHRHLQRHGRRRIRERPDDGEEHAVL